MTVADLITWLQAYAPTMEVYIQIDTMTFESVTEFVRVIQTKGEEVTEFLALKGDWNES